MYLYNFEDDAFAVTDSLLAVLESALNCERARSQSLSISKTDVCRAETDKTEYSFGNYALFCLDRSWEMFYRALMASIK